MSKVAAYHDMWSGWYDERYFLTAGLYDAVTSQTLTDVLPENKTSAILDAGAGTGLWSRRMAELGYRNLTLVDVSEGMLAHARAQLWSRIECGEAKILQGDITQLAGLSDESFDLVWAQGAAVSYCGNSTAALKELSRVLKPSGTAVVCVEAKLEEVERLLANGQVKEAQDCLETGFTYRGNPALAEPFLAEVFSPEELASACGRAGLLPIALFGKTILSAAIPVGACDSGEARWLLEFELTNNRDPILLKRANHLEVVCKRVH